MDFINTFLIQSETLTCMHPLANMTEFQKQFPGVKTSNMAQCTVSALRIIIKDCMHCYFQKQRL